MNRPMPPWSQDAETLAEMSERARSETITPLPLANVALVIGIFAWLSASYGLYYSLLVRDRPLFSVLTLGYLVLLAAGAWLALKWFEAYWKRRALMLGVEAAVIAFGATSSYAEDLAAYLRIVMVKLARAGDHRSVNRLQFLLRENASEAA
jgi:hypothetical protein